MSGLQGKSKNKGKAGPSKDRGLKRRRISPGNSLSATNTAEFTESEEPLPSSSASYMNVMTFEETDIVFKTEPMDDEGADGSPPADQKGKQTWNRLILVTVAIGIISIVMQSNSWTFIEET